jgi:hypothetical protein
MAETDTQAGTEATTERRLLTREERRDRVREARAKLVFDAFNGKQFEYVERVELPKGQTYTDVTRNQGRRGHVIRDLSDGSTITVGPSSLQKAAEMGVIQIPEGALSKSRKTATDTAAAPTEVPADPATDDLNDLLNS